MVGTGWRPLAASLASFAARPAILGPTVASAFPARNDDAAVLTAARLRSDSVSGAFSGVHCFFLNLGRAGVCVCSRQVSSVSAVPSTDA